MSKLVKPNELYVNRELSWLAFNQRVLEEALDPNTPLLERIKFLSIFDSNLDEFFMVRVAGLLKMRDEGIVVTESPDERQTSEVLSEIREKTITMIRAQHNCLAGDIMHELSANGVSIKKIPDLTPAQRRHIDQFFDDQIQPVLTPLAFDPAHPFPFLANLSLYLVVHPDDREGRQALGFVEIPSILPRLVEIPTKTKEHKLFVYLEAIIQSRLSDLFFGMESASTHVIRVTRNLDYTLLENTVTDLLKSMQHEVRNREFQEISRIEIDEHFPEATLSIISEQIGIKDDQIYRVPNPIHLGGLDALCKLNLPHLKDEPFNPRLPSAFADDQDVFSIISKKDVLVHHPYESFYAVTEFLSTAARDPDVLAIKLTLYRTAGDSPIIGSLVEAAENGKKVTAIVELKARFDEKNNISWARRLERAGINVVFGFIGLKTHGKATLVVRREKKKLVKYVHLATGNYNSATAKLYTDLGFFTRDPDIGHDVASIFNLITGFNILKGEKSLSSDDSRILLRKMALAPVNAHSHFLRLIEGEIESSKKHGSGRIIAKMNALVDKSIIDALYLASQAGVKIQLIVRGMCCLRPGVPGISENIEVFSIIDRFLEHTRVFYFQAAGDHKVFLASCDWMPRNLHRRIEFVVPITSQDLKDRLIHEILETCLSDSVKCHTMQSDGSFLKRSSKRAPMRSQQHFIELARADGIKSLPYDLAIRQDASKKGLPVAKKSRKKSTKRKKPSG